MVANFAAAYRVSVKQALLGEHAQESKEAILDEIKNMLQYKVGHYVNFKDIPKSKRSNILHSFMFLKHKETPDGKYDRTKARMVGNGANQKEHMYDLISSSTVALASVFLIMNIASMFRCILASFDIKGAFLNAKFGPKDETTYIRVSKEIAIIWIELDPTAAEFVDDRGELILELDKFIYGLKQSPYKFQVHLTDTLRDLGYVQQTHDECLYTKHVGDKFSVISTHVDDILQATNDQSLYHQLRDGLIAKYGEITCNERADSYLGMSIARSKCGRFIKLTQVGLINKLLEKHPECNTGNVRTSAAEDIFDIPSEENATTATPARKTEYLSLVMTLMYLARLTRPDILLPVTYLATKTHCVNEKDFVHAVRVVRYLRCTKDLGVILNCDSLQVQCIADASYGTHIDGMSHTGFILALGNNKSYVHARSGKQKVAATSSTEAEVIGMVECMKMGVWLRNIITNLHIVDLSSILLAQDNQSVLFMLEELSKNKRSKHILTKVCYARDLVMSGIVDAYYLFTEEMTADILTKPKTARFFIYHRDNMMGIIWSVNFP
jgi:hypothetical protein